MTELGTAPAEFPIVSVDAAPEDRQDEQVGSKAKFWFSDAHKRFCLFKRGRDNEDCSEKLGAELAALLGVAHATVELAVCDGHPGIVSPSFLARSDQLVHGNELLLEIDPGYPNAAPYYSVKQHTVDAVLHALDKFQIEAWPDLEAALPEGFVAQDLFVGYLLLDAWIGNTDRHHENWAVIQRGSRRILAPSYDHASSLGRNEAVHSIEGRLRGTDPRFTVARYAARCRSAFFDPRNLSRPMLPVGAFALAAERRPRAGAYWQQRLFAVEDARIDEIFLRIPTSRLSVAHRTFAREILRVNRDRISDLIGTRNE